jgi:putative DNA primase/helicase
MTDPQTTVEQIEERFRIDDTATPVGVVAELGLNPDRWLSPTRAIANGEEPDTPPTNPGDETEEPPKQPAETAQNTDETPISDHYNRVGEVYAELGDRDGDQCLGNTDFIGWYKTRTADSSDIDGQGRPWALGKEFAGMRADLDRVVYAAINYATEEWFLDAYQPFNYTDNGREWIGGDSPTPGYDEITAYAPFADIDLTDEIKKRRPDGDIPRDNIETALSEYIDAFADLAGGREHVFALDSVGGAYVMVAPSSTAPIAEHYDADARRLLFEDLTDRMNDWLDDTRQAVNETAPVADVFEPDLLNNKNRLYKAPMSVHSSLDGVVTPVDTSAVSYEYTPLEAVTDDAINNAAEWAAEFTDDHSDAISGLVATLWPDYYEAGEGWRDALDNRLADLRETESTNAEREARLADVDVPDDLERTDDIDVIARAVEQINVKQLAADIADDWDTAPGRDPPRFDPSWRSSSSGTSCYADRDKFVDLKEGKKGGGALKLIARERRIITDCGHKLEGEDYWKAIAELRKEGYDIPRFTGQKGTHPDNLGLHEQPDDDDEKRRQVLRALKASE